MTSLVTPLPNHPHTYPPTSTHVTSCVTSFGFKIHQVNQGHQTALGIGDILLTVLLLRENIIKEPIIFNLSYFLTNHTYPDPINALMFRLDLITRLLFNRQMIIFSYLDDTNPDHLNQHGDVLQYITQWDLDIDCLSNCTLYYLKPYVIFHTKCRWQYNPENDRFKQQLKKLFSTIKTKYRIILLGERHMVPTYEQQYLNITTIYQELLELKKNNIVYDLTVETLYNNLDIVQYLHDISFIKTAYLNVLMGYGGQLVTSLAFNCNSVLCYINKKEYTFNQEIDSNHLINNFYNFSKQLKIRLRTVVDSTQ